ncbi:MAG: zf-HC2 domain-containing protein [Treponema sp.]|nr:zf-HC2 domain-containing protein [Candidatus Treponema caballi]
MSTCPDSSLISVYLDDELPEPYKTRFEAHLASCSHCGGKLEKAKKMRDMLRADADSLLLSDEEMEAGFERLQARMTYHHVTKKSDNIFKFAVRRIAPAIAAAAVIAVILPLRLLRNDNATQPLIMPVAQTASFFPTFSSNPAKTVNTALSEANKAIRSTVSSSTMTTTVNLEDTSLATIDIFRPDFSDDVIRITIDLSTVSGLPGNDASSIMATPVSLSSEGMK